MQCMKNSTGGPKCLQGKCCCTCGFFLPVGKHPWNIDKFCKGAVSETMGYACLANENRAMFSDRGHGICEMHKGRF